jgi:hypothetical protein
LIEALPVPPATAMTIAGMAKKLRHHPAWRGPLGGAPRSITSRTPSGGGASSIRPLGLLDESMCPTQTFNINFGTSSDSSLNAGFISGSQRYNYGKENYKIPQSIIEKREKLREVSGRHGVDLRTAADVYVLHDACQPPRA